MGIEIEFNPDLALRRSRDFPARLDSECIPEPLEKGKEYPFFKRGQRFYWLKGEIPLLETKGYQRLSRPVASIKILEATHYLGKDPAGEYEGVFTKGKYEVKEVFDPKDKKIHFEGMDRVK